MKTQRSRGNYSFFCLGLTKHGQPCRNVLGQQGYDLMLIDGVGKPSKACLFTFLLDSVQYFFLWGTGQDPFLNEGLRTYHQTRQVREFLYGQLLHKKVEEGGEVRVVFQVLWLALGKTSSSFYEPLLREKEFYFLWLALGEKRNQGKGGQVKIIRDFASEVYFP